MARHLEPAERRVHHSLLVDTQASNVIVKSAVQTLVGRADAFTPNKVQGTFYILKGKWGNRIILVSPSPLFNKQIGISGMLACESLLAG